MCSEILGSIGYETAVRALDVQERGVEQLRGRTGSLLAASSLTASFLGAQAVRRASTVGLPVGLGLIALATSIVLCVYILLPKRGFVFSLSAPVVFDALYEVRDDDEEIRRRMAYWLDDYWRGNQRQVEGLGRCFLAAAFALALQLALWTWTLTATIS